MDEVIFLFMSTKDLRTKKKIGKLLITFVLFIVVIALVRPCYLSNEQFCTQPKLILPLFEFSLAFEYLDNLFWE